MNTVRCALVQTAVRVPNRQQDSQATAIQVATNDTPSTAAILDQSRTNDCPTPQ